MGLKRFLAPLISIPCAAGITVGAYLLDHQRTGVHEAVASLRIARQIASQAESLSSQARIVADSETADPKAKSDPLGWAVMMLSQGPEPRAAAVSKTKIESLQNPEVIHYDAKARVFDYSKLLDPTTSSGVRVKLALDYTGFLGAKSRLANDFALASLFALLLAVGLLGSFAYAHVSATREAAATKDELKASILAWVSRVKSTLADLGIGIRETLKQAKSLALASGEARQTIEGLRDRIREGVNELHESRKASTEAEQLVLRLKTSAMSAMAEASRLGQDSELSKMTSELHALAQSAHQRIQKSTAALGRIEVEIEPWLTDADHACHAFDGVFEATKNMDQHIRKTTSSMTSQAKLITGMQQQLSKGASPTTVKKAASG